MREIPVWKRAPFLRLIIPLIIGIILEWKCQIDLFIIPVAATISITGLIIIHFLPLAYKFTYDPLRGAFIFILLLAAGMFFTWNKDIRHDADWFQNHYHDSDFIIIKINEPLIEKPKSFKAEGITEELISGNEKFKSTGKVLLYFQKDSTLDLHYGDRIITRKSLQRIRNSGNPGSFNFEEYSAFHQTFHQLYLTKKDWVILKISDADPFKQFIYASRDRVLNILRNNITQDDKILGIAEALLIGYTRDLDKDLVQAYSNTGVVHIIAISGLHLGLIYVMLLWIIKRIPLVRRSGISKMLLILGPLWLFSFLTGGSASVLRSAVMFTCIVTGENLGRKSSIINSLAASAFILLCYDPFFIWDVGFQLSYLAVAGIIILQRPLYQLLYIKNKWVDKIWQLSSVTIAAQVFTFPVCLYYFHQFPNLFLFTNLIAVPLSSLVLFAEILLITISWIPYAGSILGQICSWLIQRMNDGITWFNNLSFSVTPNIHCSLASTLLLYSLTIVVLLWLFNKMKSLPFIALLNLLSFISLISIEKWNTANQKKIIVYNIGGKDSVDFVGGKVLPGRYPFYFFEGRRILLLDSTMHFSGKEKKGIDLLVISKNPKVSIAELADCFSIRQVVFDASNSLWKIGKWKKECELLHLPCHSVPDQGAFVTDL